MSDKIFKNEFKERCFRFSLSILHLSHSLDKSFENRILLHQLIRAATSIGANIVEGSSSISKKEFISYFQIALKSSSETIYWLDLLKKINKEKVSEIGGLINECTEIKKLLSTILIRTKAKVNS